MITINHGSTAFTLDAASFRNLAALAIAARFTNRSDDRETASIRCRAMADALTLELMANPFKETPDA